MLATRDTTIRPEFEPDSGTYRVGHDVEDSWSIATTIVLSINLLTGDDPTLMLPLHRSVDPDALERHVSNRFRTRGSSITFDFHGYHVTVGDNGQIDLAPVAECDR